MQNLVFTQLSVPEVRKLFREEIEEFFKTRTEKNNVENQDKTDIGGMELAVELTGLAKPTIYGLVSNRKIPHSKRGKRLYFSRKELTEWIAGGKRRTQAEMATAAAAYQQK